MSIKGKVEIGLGAIGTLCGFVMIGLFIYIGRNIPGILAGVGVTLISGGTLIDGIRNECCTNTYNEPTNDIENGDTSSSENRPIIIAQPSQTAGAQVTYGASGKHDPRLLSAGKTPVITIQLHH